MSNVLIKGRACEVDLGQKVRTMDEMWVGGEVTGPRLSAVGTCPGQMDRNQKQGTGRQRR